MTKHQGVRIGWDRDRKRDIDGCRYGGNIWMHGRSERERIYIHRWARKKEKSLVFLAEAMTKSCDMRKAVALH